MAVLVLGSALMAVVCVTLWIHPHAPRMAWLHWSLLTAPATSLCVPRSWLNVLLLTL